MSEYKQIGEHAENSIPPMRVLVVEVGLSAVIASQVSLADPLFHIG